MTDKCDPEKQVLPIGVGLGTMMMGWRLNQIDSEKIISLAYENEIVLLDTSVSYSRGCCHEIIGKALHNLNLKNYFTIATKVGGVSNDSDPPSNRSYSKNNIIRQCELSLMQLNIECVDLLQLHSSTKDVEFDEILEALSLLIAHDKIKNYGICNYSAHDLASLVNYANKQNFPLPIANQFEYNLLNASEKISLFEMSEAINLKTLTWGPLSSGVLTDWYLYQSCLKPGSRIAVGKESIYKKKLLSEAMTQSFLQRLSTYCIEFNIPLQVLALMWILKTKPNNSPLIGPSSISQFTQLVEGISSVNYKNIDFTSLNPIER
jgi:aryl-alcohol dehydrogenase-like predicted oxidoreductase